ncbi:hypothetical protein NDK43_24455 [Neobacillus pocheonensis]|uniref:Uncharacterized protein n=1 Tax=Neobacillus pocheonensis TaxID=363869 RepID=A0ABT0WF18_9BACI|nr:hypothetical protein [Neobacillus pocheonensis]
MIAMLTMAYSFVLQLFPPLAFSLMKKNPVSKIGASIGMIVGVSIVAYQALEGTTMATMFPSAPHFIQDLDIDVVAITINTVVMLAVSMFTNKVAVIHEEPINQSIINAAIP